MPQELTDEMVFAAMRAFEQFRPSALRYTEAEKWHACDIMGMRHAIRAAFASAIEAREGRDPQGLGAEHESAVPRERETPSSLPPRTEGGG